MASESKTFPELVEYAPARSEGSRQWVLCLQIGLVYGLIVCASWTPQSLVKAGLMVGTASLIVFFSIGSRFAGRQMGLGIPPLRGSVITVGLGILLAASLPLIAVLTGFRYPPVRVVPWQGAWQYAVWAVMQQFALQSFFYLRMESLLGSRRAVLASAILFSTVHLPSPVLVVATFFGGLFFCEMFRRYRTIVPLGLVHALLGLTIAASFSDNILHHMRVGIGYLAFHQ